MAKCRLCKKDIPEGIEYCSDCLDKKQVKSNESYLDSLLNSVKSSSEPVTNAYKRSQVNQTQQNPEQGKLSLAAAKEIEAKQLGPKPVKSEQKRYDFIDPEDLVDFDRFDINADLEDRIIIGDDELFGGDTYDTPDPTMNRDSYEDKPASPGEQNSPTSQVELYADYKPEQPIEWPEETKEPLNGYGQTVETVADQQQKEIEASRQEPEANIDSEYFLTEDEPEEEFGLDPEEEFGLVPEEEFGLEPEEKFGLEPEEDFGLEPEEEFGLESEEEFEPSLGDLLSGFATPEDGNNTSIEEENQSAEEDDFLSLLSQFSSDDPVSDDVQAISDMLSGTVPTASPGNINMPSDVGDVFSDALKAVSGLEDDEFDEAIFTKLEPQAVQDKDNKKDKKATQGRKAKSPKQAEKIAKAKTVKGKGLFGWLFGNVVDEEAIEAAAKEKAGVKEAAATKEEQKSKGKKSKKKGTPIEPQEAEEAGRKGKSSPEDAKQATAKDSKKEKVKKPKKEKKKIIEEIGDFDEVEGRINRLGASIVFLFFGVMVILLLVGTNIFTYSLSIANANTYFNRHKYTEAYNEVYGIELKDEDIVLYDKIETVMFVNKQLNSYNNYYAMKKYPEALDSLLKGLKRYDKYVELATLLGIKSDLDYVRDQILAELSHVYKLSEKAAVAILDSDSQMDYSVAIYDVVLENMDY